ncbi:MAG: hypothetical protein AABX83_03480 [Nanoarchaeota archaeon]
MYYKKRGQAWGFDLMAAMVIFITGIIIFYFYTINTPLETGQILNTLSREGEIVANAILSEGFPENWNEQNVISPGILTKNKINDTKLERFNNLTINNYPKTKALFNTKYEYYAFVSENFTINNQQIIGIGNIPLNDKNLIKISRLTVYRNKPIIFNLEIWE